MMCDRRVIYVCDGLLTRGSLPGRVFVCGYVGDPGQNLAPLVFQNNTTYIYIYIYI